VQTVKKEVIAIRKDVLPNEKVTIRERIKDNGLIEELRVRFYPGQERALQVRPYVLHDSRRIEDVFTYPDNTELFISGDDDYLIFPVSVGVRYDDEFIVEAFNNNANYTYTVVVDVVVSYEMEVE
jgi:hypothetical protein